MRLLWVKVGGLWPVTTGGRIRSFHILAELSRRHRVTILTTHGPAEDPQGLVAALPRCEVVSVPWVLAKRGSARFVVALLRSWLSPRPVDVYKTRVPELCRKVAKRLAAGGIDLVVADFLAAVPNVPVDGVIPTVLFAHNVEHVIWRRLSDVEPRAWRRLLLGLEARKMRRYERRACRRAHLTIAVSDGDCGLLRAVADGARVCAVPTGVDIDYFTPDGTRETPARLVFTGAMDWYPNEDGVTHFIETILPRVRRDVPEATLTVVGRHPSPRLLAMAKAVVSTSVGAEGLPLVPGEHFLRADDPAEFARAVTSLVHDPSRRRALGVAGRRLVEERYAWARVAAEFEARCEEVLSHAR